MENQQSFMAVFYHFGYYTDTTKNQKAYWNHVGSL